ncbi:MAG TPA: 16S rRNA (cytosine(1402)-N(4))-methyltransferase RsmH [Magnetospirillaceae bacterium]|nr:16S rRNA (cytosine(1402)-N(4))-methyltransferase RsmH [Magnetospirillaceae bacterium]
MEAVHAPVLLKEVLQLLVPPRPDGLLVDSTLGEGGHSEAFLGRYPLLRCLGVDADEEIQKRARERLAPYGGRIRFVCSYYDQFFAGFRKEVEEGNQERPGLILFDLGVSMFHFRESGRGFSLQGDEPLDMRLDRSTGRTASDLVNRLDRRALESIFRNYGEEPFSGRIARVIVEERGGRPFETSARLAETIRLAVPSKFRGGRIHPATRCFQALRIAVNDELGRIERALLDAAVSLEIGGLLGVISFHSLEDRIVKNLFRSLARATEGDLKAVPGAPIPRNSGPILRLMTRKPVVPGPEETEANRASRSAKLRVALREDPDQPAKASRRAGERKNRPS